jgi:hypothetical protein
MCGKRWFPGPVLVKPIKDITYHHKEKEVSKTGICEKCGKEGTMATDKIGYCCHWKIKNKEDGLKTKKEEESRVVEGGPVICPAKEDVEDEIVDAISGEPKALENLTVEDILRREKEEYVAAAAEWNRKIDIIDKMLDLYMVI